MPPKRTKRAKTTSKAATKAPTEAAAAKRGRPAKKVVQSITLHRSSSPSPSSSSSSSSPPSPSSSSPPPPSHPQSSPPPADPSPTPTPVAKRAIPALALANPAAYGQWYGETQQLTHRKPPTPLPLIPPVYPPVQPPIDPPSPPSPPSWYDALFRRRFRDPPPWVSGPDEIERWVEDEGRRVDEEIRVDLARRKRASMSVVAQQDEAKPDVEAEKTRIQEKGKEKSKAVRHVTDSSSSCDSSPPLESLIPDSWLISCGPEYFTCDAYHDCADPGCQMVHFWNESELGGDPPLVRGDWNSRKALDTRMGAKGRHVNVDGGGDVNVWDGDVNADGGGGVNVYGGGDVNMDGDGEKVRMVRSADPLRGGKRAAQVKMEVESDMPPAVFPLAGAEKRTASKSVRKRMQEGCSFGIGRKPGRSGHLLSAATHSLQPATQPTNSVFTPPTLPRQQPLIAANTSFHSSPAFNPQAQEYHPHAGSVQGAFLFGQQQQQPSAGSIISFNSAAPQPQQGHMYSYGGGVLGPPTFKPSKLQQQSFGRPPTQHQQPANISRQISSRGFERGTAASRGVSTSTRTRQRGRGRGQGR